MIIKNKQKELFISFLTVLLPVLLQLVYIRIVSYSIDKEVYGQWVLLQTFIVALSYILLQIPSQAYNRFYNTTMDKVSYLNEFRSMLIFINIISFISIIIYGLVMGNFSQTTLLLLFVYFVILNNYTFNQQIFLLNLERVKYFKLKIVEAIAKYIFPIIFYFYYKTLDSFIIGLIVGYILSFIVISFFLKNYKFKFIINLINLKKYFIFAYPIIFVSIFSWGISFSDRYFLNYFMDYKDVAIYAILAQVAGIGNILGQIYGLYVNPKVLKLYEEDKKISLNFLNKSLILLFIISLFIILFSCLIPSSVYELLLEPKIITNSYYFLNFVILLVSAFGAVYQAALGMYFTLYKRLGVLAYIYAIAFFINLFMNFGIEKYGMIAASISTLVAYLSINLMILFMIIKLKREVNEN
jgi:O-antigen/teichoic acid export membrane protein